MAADAGVSVLVAFAEKVIPPAVDAVGRQARYLFFYNSNIKDLEEEVAALERTRKDADIFFRSHEWNNEKRTQSSACWLTDVEEVMKAAAEVKEAANKSKIVCFYGWCPKLKDRYLLSKKATKKADEIRKLQDQALKRNYVHAVNSALPPGMLPGSSSNDGSKDFKSRLEVMDKVMEALKDDNINSIGICGLGGIGKTTILHELRSRARVQNLFDEFPMITLSQDAKLFKIQGDLASSLGLISMKEIEGTIARADVLRQRLTSGSRILVVLDDVWSEIKLKEVGIPVGNDRARCKVVLASRYESVCTKMETQKIISVEVLPKEEAWDMFKKTAGDCLESENLERIAKEIVAECGGLPIALLTLAKALSNKEKKAWKDARKQLREGKITSIQGMGKEVYLSIKLSYDFLASEQQEAQLLLLLCSQHPEDADIKVEKLARYCMALELFEDIDKLEDARNRIYVLVEHLKSCFLLQVDDVGDEEREWKEKTVKVHDVVRDVCLSILSGAREERERVLMHIMARKTDDGYDVGTRAVDYQKLKIVVQDNGDFLNVNFLKQMEELRVFENLRGILGEGQTPALDVLTNLRMLSLEWTHLDKSIGSMVGSLHRLEILSFWGSKMSIPHQIGQLSNLKLLDLRCEGAGPIPSGILPGLKKLEVLYMGKYFLFGRPDQSKDGINGDSYGHVAELEKLRNLTSLQIYLLDSMNLLDLQHFPFENLERFHIRIEPSNECSYRVGGNLLCPLIEKTFDCERVGMQWVLGEKIQSMVKSTACLFLKDIDLSDPHLIREFVSLRNLHMISCDHLDYLIHDGDRFMHLEKLYLEMDNLTELCHNGNLPAGSLGNLQKLSLQRLPRLRRLWAGPTHPMCLVNLRMVDIYKCPMIEYIFPHTAVKCLGQLQALTVEKCDMLLEFASKEEESSTGAEIEEPSASIIQFSKLKKVYLRQLPNLWGINNLLFMFPCIEELSCMEMHQLKHVAESNQIMLLQNLKQVSLTLCGSLEVVFDFEGLVVMREAAHTVLGKLDSINLQYLPNLNHICRLVPSEVHGFQNLRSLYVKACGSLGYLLSSSMASMLVNLITLDVENCKVLKDVIKMNENDSGKKKIVLHSLGTIRLRYMEKLSSFCSSDLQEFEFPALEKVFIVQCPEMKTFCYGQLTAPKLQGVKFTYTYFDDNKDDISVWKSDLNETVRYFNVSDPKEHDAGGITPVVVAKNIDEYKVSEDLHVDDYALLDNEGTSSNSAIGPLASLVLSCPDSSLVPPIVSPTPSLSNDNKELSYSSSSDLKNVASPRLIELVPSTSTELSVHSDNSQLQSEVVTVLSNTPVQLEKILPSSHDRDPSHEEMIIATMTEQSNLVPNKTDSQPDELISMTRKSASKGIEVEMCSLDEVSQNESSSFTNVGEPTNVTRELVSHSNHVHAGGVDVALASWQGHVVTLGDKDFLEAVGKHFPQTFDEVNFHSEATWEVALHTFCGHLRMFLGTSVSDLSSREVAKLRGMLLDLVIFKFKVDWALDRLEKIDKLRFGSRLTHELVDIERHRASLWAKVEHLEAELVLVREELGKLDILHETKRKRLFDEFGGDGLCLLEGLLGRGLLPSYQLVLSE